MILEDWKMTKDRIKHFDDIIFRLRLEGIPIASGIMGAGLISFEYTAKIVFHIGNVRVYATSIIILMAAIYLMPIFTLDWVYYRLLKMAVDHAKELEETTEFKGKLRITSILTHEELTRIHNWTARIIYGLVIIASVVIAIAVNYVPIE